MKLGLILLALSTAVTTFAQVRVTGTLHGGSAYNHTSHLMVKTGAEVHVTLPSGIFFAGTAQLGLNGKRTVARNVLSNSTYSILVGREQIVNDHFAIRPYAGIGYQRSLQTNFLYDDSLNAALALAAGVVDITTDQTLDFEKRYLAQRYTTFGVPVGVDFLIGKRGIGLTIGYYLFVSNYTETGVRLGLTFGKIR